MGAQKRVSLRVFRARAGRRVCVRAAPEHVCALCGHGTFGGSRCASTHARPGQCGGQRAQASGQRARRADPTSGPPRGRAWRAHAVWDRSLWAHAVWAGQLGIYVGPPQGRLGEWG
eukprot:4087382-Prymnesium_polylepis.1